MTCSIAGCGLPVKTKNYCTKHYKRLLRHGDPLGGGVPRNKNVGACKVDGCGGPAQKAGLCDAHYLRKRRFGRLHLEFPQRQRAGNHCGRQCPGAKKLQAQLDYLRNPEKFKRRSAQWIIDNEDRYRSRLEEYLSRLDVKARMRVVQARRRAAELQATPSWLTEEHLAQIRAIYDEAVRLTESTGIPHDVDHIVPLQGRTVCGLHVPWNLRAIPKEQNLRRPRIWAGELD